MKKFYVLEKNLTQTVPTSLTVISSIFIPASLKGAIVTESRIQCIYSDLKVNKESDGGNYILVH